jgi:hypothetical protein
MDRFVAKFEIEVQKSPMLEGWYARIIIEDGKIGDPGQQLTGRGSTAIAAAQSALGQFASGSTYQQLILETAFMHGTRTATKLELNAKKGRKSQS